MEEAKSKFAKILAGGKMKKLIFKNLVLIILIFALAGCASLSQRQNKETLFQVSTIDALMQGFYDGQLTFAQLQERGDFGIGTFGNHAYPPSRIW